eukprot:symbB.v1.2.019269.t2/scaffold1509.1/size114668/4
MHTGSCRGQGRRWPYHGFIRSSNLAQTCDCCSIPISCPLCLASVAQLTSRPKSPGWELNQQWYLDGPPVDARKGGKAGKGQTAQPKPSVEAKAASSSPVENVANDGQMQPQVDPGKGAGKTQSGSSVKAPPAKGEPPGVMSGYPVKAPPGNGKGHPPGVMYWFGELDPDI